MNRNRHTKIEPKPVDPELSVLRFDDLQGKPIAVLVNFAAHPTMLKPADRLFSADYPGQMKNEVERVLGTQCVFMQGAAGDMSRPTTDKTRGIEKLRQGPGQRSAGDQQAALKRKCRRRPSIQGMDETFSFKTRVDSQNPLVLVLLWQAFFPELARPACTTIVQNNTLHPHLTTVLVNGELALVGGSGEFFCDHSNRTQGPFACQEDPLLRLLQRPPMVLPHDPSRCRRRLRRRCDGELGGPGGRRRDDEQGPDQHLHDAGQVQNQDPRPVIPLKGVDGVATVADCPQAIVAAVFAWKVCAP